MAKDNWEYKTKCRICGGLTDWHFSRRDNLAAGAFGIAMSDHTRNPRQHNCDPCGKKTVQDVVSYDQ